MQTKQYTKQKHKHNNNIVTRTKHRYILKNNNTQHNKTKPNITQQMATYNTHRQIIYTCTCNKTKTQQQTANKIFKSKQWIHDSLNIKKT